MANIARMDGAVNGARPTPAWTVVVVRGWTEHGTVRVRLLRSGSTGGPTARVVASAEEAASTVRAWLLEIADEPDDRLGPDEMTGTRTDR